LLENLDINALKASNFVMTRPDFFEMMCDVERSKHVAIKDIQNVFRYRLKYLVGAKDYEVKCERNLSIQIARTIMNERAIHMQKDFTLESSALKA